MSQYQYCSRTTGSVSVHEPPQRFRNLFTKQCLEDLALSLIWEAKRFLFESPVGVVCADCPWPCFVPTSAASII